MDPSVEPGRNNRKGSTMGDTTVIKNYCGECRSVITESPSTPVEMRQPCAECGSTARHVELFVTETVTVREMVGVKARYGDHGKPFREVKSGDELYRDTGSGARSTESSTGTMTSTTKSSDARTAPSFERYMSPFQSTAAVGAARGSDDASQRQ